MQDGALCHTAKSLKKLLASQKIPLLDWPGNFPRFKPIENVWDMYLCIKERNFH